MMKMAKKSGDKPSKRGNMGVYSSLVADRTKRLVKSASGAVKNAAQKKSSGEKSNLKPLPKAQPARFFAHFRWERIRAYWFSKAGLRRVGKIFAACFLLGVIGIGALFVYYKNQLKEIQLNDLTISETVNTYLDRNGVVLWEDKGDADYRLVVDESDIATYVRQATVAIEDRNFYNHPGVDIGALVRATILTLTRKSVQGGSTLTQQLIKQLYFADEAESENRGGIARKVKELILSIELEKMYSKEQIITMYLNESPYGGRRNGIESAAQTYFGKSAKELNLAESALLAAIPNNPAVLNPYNEWGHEWLIERQHKVLNDMVEVGYISQEEADAAKEVAILDQIKPESTQYANIKAPHFVLEVRDRLEEKYGIQFMRTGGYTITTTLDYRAQEMAERAVANGAKLTYMNGSDNIAMASVDVETGQMIAMVGSIDWNKPVYGEVNAAVADLEPGSSIKPILDYAPLFSLTGDQVYGPGTILKDENIDHIYCAGYMGGNCALRNALGAFYGNLPIRKSLGNSLNIAAVKALAITGIDNALEIAHGLGDKNYCAGRGTAGLSMAIGSGCAVRADEHANAYASIARGGVYRDLTYVLEMKDLHGKIVDKWEDSKGERIIDEQVAYEVADILGDHSARKIVFGDTTNQFGFAVPGVWTGSKTGTTTTANSGVAKDSWMASFSTAVATVVWNGNHDGSGLTGAHNNIVRRVVADYMEPVHKEIYAQDGRWKSGDKPRRPSGIQELTVNGVKDIWPSWYNAKKSNIQSEKVAFNKENGLRAADCTPESKRVTVDVTRTKDPVSGVEIVNVPDGYKYNDYDTCNNTTADVHPTIRISKVASGEASYLNILIGKGTYDLSTYKITVDGVTEKSGAASVGTIKYVLDGGENSITVEVTDAENNTTSETYVVGTTDAGTN